MKSLVRLRTQPFLITSDMVDSDIPHNDGMLQPIGIVIPEELRAYVAPKGSLAVDGVSLTVAAWKEPQALVALVPYTLEHTIASEYESGGTVNLEVDVLARYLERLIAARGNSHELRRAPADARGGA